MSKWYEIDFAIYKTYAIEVKDSEGEYEATEVLLDEFLGDQVEIEGTRLLDTEHRIDQARRLADECMPLPDEPKNN